VGACTLSIEGHLVVRCEGGVPEAEYALFDEGDVELRSVIPGSIREDAYTTTVERARAHLAAAGVSAELAERAAAALAPRFRVALARGATVRPLAAFLGPTELFAGGAFDPGARSYRGAWLEVDRLAKATGLAGAPSALQALHLASLLAECEPGARVTLVTRDVTRDAPAGTRTFRRVAVAHASELPDALRNLGDQVLTAQADMLGPTREELLADVHARMGLAPDAATQERLLAVERALTARPRPSIGPLADEVLWSLELQLTVGDARGVGDRCDAFERQRGRSPATAYLRARAALLTGAEPAEAIAERVSSLAGAMDGFRELTLLAAQAWAAAGNLERAHAYAKDLADDPRAHDELRARAADLAADAAAGRRPRLSVAPRPAPVDVEPAHAGHPARQRPEVDPRSEPPDSARGVAGGSEDAMPPEDATLVDGDLSALARDSDAPPPASTPPLSIPRDRPPPAITAPMTIPATTLASLTYDAGAVKQATITAHAPPRSMRGASQPPFASVAPPAASAIPEQPLAPPPQEGHSERLEKLTLPPGLHGQAPTSELLPRTVLDARVLFTYLARDLARELRELRGVEVRTDVAGVEAVQRDLRARFPAGVPLGDGAGFAMRRHGALLSEVYARTLGAYWLDIAPSELGYWAMIVPSRTRTVRVLPFGRVYRFVAVAHEERDLVATYRELYALVHGHA